MLTIPADIILEKNKLYSGDAFVELLEWQVGELSSTVRIANYNEDVTWDGETWTKFYFKSAGEIDSGGDSSESIQIAVSAVDKLIQEYLEQLDNGGIGDTIIYRRVHTGHLDLGAALTASFEIMDIDAGPSNEWVIFTVGQENFFLSQFPANVFRRDICRYNPWQTGVCPYVNNSVCDRTFGTCLLLHQESVFGGQPGIPGGAFNLEFFRSLTNPISLDAKLHKSGQVISTSLDVILGVGAGFSVASLDALITAISTKTAPPPVLDAILIGEVTTATALDAKIAGGLSSTALLDAVLFGTKSTSLDGLIFMGGTASVGLDSQIYSDAITKTVDIDALIQRTVQPALSVDAKLNKAQTSSIGIDSLLFSVGSYFELTSMDAMLYGDFISDPDGTPIGDPDGEPIGEPD